MIKNFADNLRKLLQKGILVMLFAAMFAQSVTVFSQYTESVPNIPADIPQPFFRVEKTAVAGGSEIVTIFARPAQPDANGMGPPTELPLISILRDTLGDDRPENDRLRYVWMLTHTRTSFSQKLSAVVPFLYGRTTNKGDVGTDEPPSIIDVQSPNQISWNKVFWILFKRLVLVDFNAGVRAPTLQYRQNAADYRRSAAAAALSVLSMYQEIEGEKVLTDSETHDIQARLALTDKTFGWHMQSENLERVHEREQTKVRDLRGHNWELLRQQAEAEGLYFDPFVGPDGTSRHAMVWTTADDIAANKARKFNGRFLNFKSPWADRELANWKGFSQTRWFDSESREVESGEPGAASKRMIPLALYGLDHPKIPVLLVDFRDNKNPRKREISKRILDDVTGGVISLSRFGGVPFFFGRFLFDFITRRRGMDLNFESRHRSYSQLKLLINLETSLDADLRSEIEGRIESATINPMQNDADVEERIARQQYKNLMEFARRPDGLPRRVMNDRREEMARLVHGRPRRALHGLANLATFGIYKHRETVTPELLAQMDTRRQLDYHERYLRETAFASARPEVDADMADLRRSLTFVAANGEAAGEKTARALTKIFSLSAGEELRAMCLGGLYRINNSSAKKELLAIYNNSNLDLRWRSASADYLKRALAEGQTIARRDAGRIAGISAN